MKAASMRLAALQILLIPMAQLERVWRSNHSISENKFSLTKLILATYNCDCYWGPCNCNSNLSWTSVARSHNMILIGDWDFGRCHRHNSDEMSRCDGGESRRSWAFNGLLLGWGTWSLGFIDSLK